MLLFTRTLISVFLMKVILIILAIVSIILVCGFAYVGFSEPDITRETVSITIPSDRVFDE